MVPQQEFVLPNRVYSYSNNNQRIPTGKSNHKWDLFNTAIISSTQQFHSSVFSFAMRKRSQDSYTSARLSENVSNFAQRCQYKSAIKNSFELKHFSSNLSKYKSIKYKIILMLISAAWFGMNWESQFVTNTICYSYFCYNRVHDSWIFWRTKCFSDLQNLH